MKKLTWQAWDHWWCRQAPPHALALFRILLGLFLLVYVGTYAPNIRLLFSADGLALPLYAHKAPAFLQPVLSAPPPGVAYALFGLLVLCIVMATVGVFFRAAMWTLVLLALYHWQLSLHLFPTSYNRLFFLTLLVMAFSDADRTLSLRSYLEQGSVWASQAVCILPQRLLAVQVTMTYLGVGWQKVVLEPWHSGEILAFSFASMWASPLAFWFLQLNFPMQFYDFSVFTVTAFEVFLPLGLWHRASRVWWMAGGVLFHLFITLFLEIWWFVALYATYLLFFEPEEVRDWLHRRRKQQV